MNKNTPKSAPLGVIRYTLVDLLIKGYHKPVGIRQLKKSPGMAAACLLVSPASDPL
jgi:hypothetical protein